VQKRHPGLSPRHGGTDARILGAWKGVEYALQCGARARGRKASDKGASKGCIRADRSPEWMLGPGIGASSVS